jgi:hypothetical protein
MFADGFRLGCPPPTRDNLEVEEQTTMTLNPDLPATVDPNETDSPPKQCDGHFQTGVSGNPKGRPQGSRNRATLALEALLDDDGTNILRRAIDSALKGDPVAMKLCVERLVPVRRERPICVDLPELRTAASINAKFDLLFEAVADGRLLPTEGEKLANLLAAQLKAKEVDDLERRVAALEAKQMEGYEPEAASDSSGETAG